MATIQERVKVLENFPLIDEQQTLEGPSLAIGFDSDSSVNYEDRTAFETKWNEELETMAKFKEISSQGEYYIHLIYTYRSCSKCLPQAGANDPNREEILRATIQILEPEIAKLKNFMNFQREAIAFLCDEARKMASPGPNKKDVFSESFIWCFIKLLDLFATLDAVKNMKASLQNDFAAYKRASYQPNQDAVENKMFGLFLATQNSIMTELKNEAQKIPNFDEIFALMLNQCALFLEEERYLLPSEKHCLLRVLPSVLFVLDGPEGSPYNAFKSKRINIPRIAKLVKKYPIVPLYGDMQVTLEQLIKRSPHFDEKIWGPPVVDSKTAQEYELLYQIAAVRTAYNEYLAKFTGMTSEIAKCRREGKILSFVNSKEVTVTVFKGFQLLSEWTSKVLQQTAWKYANPKQLPGNTGADVVEYELVVKRNYTTEERFVLIEFISMIKSLAGVMLKYDGLIAGTVRRTIHDELQEFIQIHLRELICYASKKKKPMRSELLQLRFIAADWVNGTEPNDPSLFGKKPNKGEQEKISIPSRVVGPSATQLELIRSLIYGFICHKTYGDKKKSAYSDKEFKKDSHIKLLEDFYARSFFYQYLLHYAETILQITDLADLWYREFYLELSKKLQFPIDMSLPWILTDTILESNNASMFEYILYPLDLYNDAAHRALSALHQRFLYDEIEAEVNLAFDQLVYKLSESIFAYFKSQASCLLMEKNYKSQLESTNTKATAQGSNYQPKRTRFDVILRQKHFHLLGRTLDFSYLITQRMNNIFRQNIDYAIAHFEANDLTCIIELEMMLDNAQLTHSLLSQYLDLDPYESMFKETNESTSVASFHGRIAIHIVYELVYDLFPNWNFNQATQRFVRSLEQKDVGRDKEPRARVNIYGNKQLQIAYLALFELYKRRFFGLPHILSMVRIVGKSALPLIISECITNTTLKIANVLGPYVHELLSAMPPSSKLPIYDYGLQGTIGYFQLKLQDVINYPESADVWQNLKEFGNAIIFLNLLDATYAQAEAASLVVAAPFLGLTGASWPMGVPERDPTLESPLYYIAKNNVELLLSRPGAAKCPEILSDIATSVYKADQTYRPHPQNLSLFRSALRQINFGLNSVREEWDPSGTLSVENGFMYVESSKEFCRVWSALQFIYCSSTEEPSLEELHGDSLQWAGCTIIYLLGQKERFEAFDFSYHALNVAEASVKPEDNPKNVALLKKMNAMKEHNNLIFGVLSAFAPLPEPTLLCIRPPTNDAELLGAASGVPQGPPQQLSSPFASSGYSSAPVAPPSAPPSSGYHSTPAAPPPSKPHSRTPPAPVNLPPPPPSNLPSPSSSTFDLPPPPSSFDLPPPPSDLPPPPSAFDLPPPPSDLPPPPSAFDLPPPPSAFDLPPPPSDLPPVPSRASVATGKPVPRPTPGGAAGRERSSGVRVSVAPTSVPQPGKAPPKVPATPVPPVPKSFSKPAPPPTTGAPPTKAPAKPPSIPPSRPAVPKRS